jgi:hypothetical protein
MEKPTNEQFAELVEYIDKNLVRTHQDISRFALVNVLFDFQDKHNLLAMYRFWKWMSENGYGDDEIFATIMHDLNGRNEYMFCPRTSSY